MGFLYTGEDFRVHRGEEGRRRGGGGEEEGRTRGGRGGGREDIRCHTDCMLSGVVCISKANRDVT
jgi:hypothetical protein